nr:glycosyl hydrolase family 28-related protein [Planctomycetota bacterium]
MPVPKIHLSICVFLLCALGLTGAEPLRYPPGFGVVDVTQAPYHADASGATDASAAIQQAIQDHHRRGNRIIYLPPGVYRIDQPVRWQHGSTLGPSLHGAGPAHTVLRVPANTPAFADQDQRHGVLYTGGGMSADRFCIDVADLAIEVGADNPGACGIQYMANNQASLRNLHIRAAPNSGAVGIDMAHSDMVGPALISDVEVEGFAWGIRCAYSVNSQTFERVTLRQQREGGLHNAGQVVTVRRLVSENRVPAVVTAAGTASTVLVDCDFTGGDPGAWAIDNAAALWARDISCSGYRGVLRDAAGEQTRVHEVPFIDEYVSGPSVSIFSGVERSLRLPIQETPQVAWGDVADWINVADFGAIPGDKIDDTAAIQAAFDSGAASVFLPASDTKRGYRIEGSITIPVTLQRLIQGGGQWGGLDLIGAGEHGGLVIDGAGPPLLIERLTAWDVGGADRPLIQHLGSRSVVIAHVNTLLRDCALYVAEPGAGDLFLEDVACHWPMKSTVTWRWPNLRLAPG